MYRKIISSVLIVALLNLLGCYASDLIEKTKYNQIKETDKSGSIKVITKDSEEYNFTESNFYVENDTLYGKLPLGYTGKLYDENIALSDIESIYYYNFDVGATVAIGLIIVGVVAFIRYEASNLKINIGGK